MYKDITKIPYQYLYLLRLITRKNRWIILLISLSVFLGRIKSPVLAEQVCTVNITSPSGGETFTEGQTMNITWNASSNVDKVSIMYKSDQHHGNWVVFTTANTGSYAWNIDVGNTTNTQFYIEITAYETGKGSCTAFTNYFTINQKPDAPPTPTSSAPPNTGSPSIYPLPPSYSNKKSPYIRAEVSPTPLPIPTPTAQPKPTLNWVTLAPWFYFEGSLTTDLKSIKDPTKVESFTLDTIQGWTFIWLETLNLADPAKIRALQNIGNYWIVEEWFFWIKVEWWEIFTEPIEVTLKDESLTGYQPHLKVTETKETEKAETVLTVRETNPGKIKAAMTGAAKVEVLPRVELFGEKEIRISRPEYTLEGQSSHKDLIYKLKINGQEKEVTPDEFNPDGGKFKLKVNNLIKGANFVQLWYKWKDKDYQLAGEKTIYYQPNYLYKALLTLAVIAGVIGLIGAGVFLGRKGALSQKLGKPIVQAIRFLKKRCPLKRIS